MSLSGFPALGIVVPRGRGVVLVGLDGRVVVRMQWGDNCERPSKEGVYLVDRAR